MQNEAFGKRVAARREQLGLSQTQLAERITECARELSGPDALVVSQQSIAQLEAGGVRRPRYLLELAFALERPPEWLISGRTTERAEIIAAASALMQRLDMAQARAFLDMLRTVPPAGDSPPDRSSGYGRPFTAAG